MANSDKNILITPATNTNGDPTIVYTPNTAANAITQRLTNSGAISFEGSAGQLFSINNSLTGTLFSVNDISGIPSIDVADTGLVRIAPFNGTLAVGGTAILGTARFSVSAAASSVGIIVRGNATTPGNLQEWQNSNPTTLASISNTGAFTATSITSTGSISSNTSGQGSITLGDAAITKQSGSAFQFGSGANFTQVVSVPNLTSTIATGTAPFTVTSTTQVANLNVAVSGLAVNLIGGTANKGEIVYQSGVNTTAELTAPTTNMSALLYNTSTNAPYWSAPLEALTSLRGYTFTASTGTFTALTNTSSHHQEFSGTSGQTIGLPNTATLTLGTTFYISARTLGTVTVNTFGNAATALVMPGGTDSGAIFTCVNTASNSITGWDVGFTKFSTRTGTGAVVLNNTPTFVSPVLGDATGTSLNVTGQLISTQATGTAPFVVSSTTQVANLNASTTSISVNIGAGAAGSLPYQTATNTTAFLARTATNNSTLAFNSSTNAPFWIQPTLSNTYYAATTSAQIAGVVSDETGSGALVFGTTPTITSPNIATSLTTTSSTFSLINTAATTINFGGAATLMNIGSTVPGSFVDMGYDLVVSNNLAVDQAATFGGGFGSTGVSISAAGQIDANGSITAEGNITVGTALLNGALTRAFLAGGGTTGATFSNTGALIRTSSSARYKQDISDVVYSYEDILRLSPKTFRLKEEAESNPNARVYGGLIAEDVHELESLKVFVNYQTQEDGSKIPDGIAYGEMVSALVSALKHQNSIIENLTSRVEFLENN